MQTHGCKRTRVNAHDALFKKELMAVEPDTVV